MAQIWTLFVTPGHGLVFRSAAANQNTTYSLTADKVIMVAGIIKGLPVGRDTSPAVFQRRRRVLSWCGALTNSRSANIHNKLTEVGGLL